MKYNFGVIIPLARLINTSRSANVCGDAVQLATGVLFTSLNLLACWVTSTAPSRRAHKQRGENMQQLARGSPSRRARQRGRKPELVAGVYTPVSPSLAAFSSIFFSILTHRSRRSLCVARATGARGDGRGAVVQVRYDLPWRGVDWSGWASVADARTFGGQLLHGCKTKKG